MNYFSKIPIILKSPQLIARNISFPNRYLFFDRVVIKELDNEKCLLCVVLIKSNINVVWNFYWLEENKVPAKTEIIYKSKSYKKNKR